MSVSGNVGIFITLSILAFAAAPARGPSVAAPQETKAPAPPGPLSASHAELPGLDDCEACHSAPGETAPAKCLACHDEIALRLAAARGYHKDKAEGCGTCHAEHQGPDASLLPLDPADFDHAETGYALAGAHARVKGCDPCHLGSDSLKRTVGRSYLLKDARCLACHVSPHPGRQETCLACHSMDGWWVGLAPAAR